MNCTNGIQGVQKPIQTLLDELASLADIAALLLPASFASAGSDMNEIILPLAVRDEKTFLPDKCQRSTLQNLGCNEHRLFSVRQLKRAPVFLPSVKTHKTPCGVCPMNKAH
jgi:hypothetical protein